MGVLIEAPVALKGGRGPRSATSLTLTERAAAQCLRSAGRAPSEIGMLISTGIYHDRNLAEPALAALVQEDVGANLGHPPIGGHGTFSFDLLNGTCGALNAAQLVEGFMRSRAINLAMVVAGDARPQPSRGFTFARSGAAMLLRWEEGDAGFQGFLFRTFPEHRDLFVATLAWETAAGWHLPLQKPGHNLVAVVERAEYLTRSVDCAALATLEFLASHGMTPKAIDVLVAAHTSPGFGDLVAGRLGIANSAVVPAGTGLEHAHTALPIAALAEAERRGLLTTSHQVLVVTAGAGITVGLALYRGA